MIVGHIGGGGAAGAPVYEIEKSLRVRAAASGYLSRTFGTPTDQNVWTLSTWVKRGELGRANMHLFATQGSGATSTGLLFGATGALDTLRLVNSSAGVLASTAVFRDPSAHCHIVVRYDNTACTVWVNGTVVISGTQNMVGINYAGRTHRIGCSGYAAGSQVFDGYLSDIYFIDGQALTPDEFGEFNADGVWVPKPYTGTYGTNGFYLPFNDGTNLTELCRDRSGNGNDWTATGVSLTPGATYDWMDDTPTNNFAVLNVIHAGRSTLTNGNLTASGSTDLPTIIPSSGTWYFERGGVAQTWTPPAAFPAGAGDYNFGQRPFSGSPTHPTLCTKNRPSVTITDPSQHHTVITVTKSGDTNFTLPWDATDFDTLFWIKRRDAAGDWYQIDGLRGYDKILKSNSTAAETTDANVLGVSGTTCTLKSTLPNGTYVIYAWKAGLASARQTNTDGSITSTVSRNVTAGFSIVTYTGTGANATVGHGLGNAPKMVFWKVRSNPNTWGVYHQSAGPTAYLELNSTAAQSTLTTNWLNSTAPSSSVLTLGNGSVNNQSGNTLVAYCHAEIPGYSKFGSYTGNGSTDGPFVWGDVSVMDVLVKNASAASQWRMADSLRSQHNASILSLRVNASNSEDSTNFTLDLNSSGLKVRGTGTDSNDSGNTYIYAAYARHPFGAENVSPAPAR